jgi:large subunit ribosomal protein L22
MSEDTPKDAEPETPEAEEEAPKPRRRSRAKKAAEPAAEGAAATAAEGADESTEEEAPKPRRSRRKKADAEEAAPAEPVAEGDADEAASDEPVAEEPADAVASEEADDEIEPTDEDIEAADEAASEEELEEEAEEEEAAPAARRRRGRRGAEPAEEAPAPAPRRTRPAPGERVLVRAQAKYVRTSARKARLVCDHIRGKSVQEARAILAHTPRAVARDWSKLLESAVANAEHNHELLGDDLRIASVTADEGPTLKRFRPRAMGRATRIRKRTSHLTILLTPKES